MTIIDPINAIFQVCLVILGISYLSAVLISLKMKIHGAILMRKRKKIAKDTAEREEIERLIMHIRRQKEEMSIANILSWDKKFNSLKILNTEK